jgi:hypothetical protein
MCALRRHRFVHHMGHEGNRGLVDQGSLSASLSTEMVVALRPHVCLLGFGGPGAM